MVACVNFSCRALTSLYLFLQYSSISDLDFRSLTPSSIEFIISALSLSISALSSITSLSVFDVASTSAIAPYRFDLISSVLSSIMLIAFTTPLCILSSSIVGEVLQYLVPYSSLLTHLHTTFFTPPLAQVVLLYFAPHSLHSINPVKAYLLCLEFGVAPLSVRALRLFLLAIST